MHFSQDSQSQSDLEQLPMDILSSISATNNTTSSIIPHDKSAKTSEIELPQRPKSTPFPLHELIPKSQEQHEHVEVSPARRNLSEDLQATSQTICAFDSLPPEIHEIILKFCLQRPCYAARNHTALHGWHKRPIPKGLFNLALINKQYRLLVQARLFKQITVKGTRQSISRTIEYFINHPHLQAYPRHIKLWCPAWERIHDDVPGVQPPNIIRARASQAVGLNNHADAAAVYQHPTQNASLFEMLEFISLVFPYVTAVSIEGGLCKKPPQIRYFDSAEVTSLPVLPSVKSLALTSAWNIMRTVNDFNNIMAAMPNLQEWHVFYARAKSKSYLNISDIIPYLPDSIRYVNLGLETDYVSEHQSSRAWNKVFPSVCHICCNFAQALPHLERFVYNGRICKELFTSISLPVVPGVVNETVKVIDLTVKNCCRPLGVPDGTDWASDPTFVLALEDLVVAAINSLKFFTKVEQIRIKFVTLGSPMHLLHPYFHMKGNMCAGLWSDRICIALAASRPQAKYASRCDMDFDGLFYDVHTDTPHYRVSAQSRIKCKPLCLKVSGYITRSFLRPQTSSETELDIH